MNLSKMLNGEISFSVQPTNELVMCVNVRCNSIGI